MTTNCENNQALLPQSTQLRERSRWCAVSKELDSFTLSGLALFGIMLWVGYAIVASNTRFDDQVQEIQAESLPALKHPSELYPLLLRADKLLLSREDAVLPSDDKGLTATVGGVLLADINAGDVRGIDWLYSKSAAQTVAYVAQNTPFKVDPVWVAYQQAVAAAEVQVEQKHDVARAASLAELCGSGLAFPVDTGCVSRMHTVKP